jgi:hypothetical protein
MVSCIIEETFVPIGVRDRSSSGLVDAVFVEYLGFLVDGSTGEFELYFILWSGD